MRSTAPAHLLSSAHNAFNFLTLYLLHFPTLYPFLKEPIPEGRAGTVPKASKQVNPTPQKNFLFSFLHLQGSENCCNG
jgi:hypothetical protein